MSCRTRSRTVNAAIRGRRVLSYVPRVVERRRGTAVEGLLIDTSQSPTAATALTPGLAGSSTPTRRRPAPARAHSGRIDVFTRSGSTVADRDRLAVKGRSARQGPAISARESCGLVGALPTLPRPCEGCRCERTIAGGAIRPAGDDAVVRILDLAGYRRPSAVRWRACRCR
jgi:hypothetical protein